MVRLDTGKEKEKKIFLLFPSGTSAGGKGTAPIDVRYAPPVTEHVTLHCISLCKNMGSFPL